jgi:hypothetical protein
MPRNPQIDPPDWWERNLAFTPHVESRMDEREFSELDLRTMIADATDLVSSRRPDRYLASTRLRGRPWTIVLEPDPEDQLLFVVTAYPRERP